MDSERVAAILEERLGQAVVGGISARRAWVEFAENSAGDDAYLVNLLVDDPAAPTWSVQDLTQLDLLANRIAAEAGAREYVYVNLTATRDVEQADGAPAGSA